MLPSTLPGGVLAERSQAGSTAGMPPPGAHQSPDNAPPMTLAQRLAALSSAREEAWGPPGWRRVGTYDPYGYFASLAVWEARAARTFAAPWLLVVAFALLVTLVHKLALSDAHRAALTDSTAAYASGYSLVLAVVGFLLVFRLNRAALRFWDARTGWGRLVEGGRLLTEQACVHCGHDKALRDDIVRWCAQVAAFQQHQRQFIMTSSHLVYTYQFIHTIFS